MRTAGSSTRARLLTALIFALACVVPGFTGRLLAQHETPHWDYERNGPAVWGSLSPEFVACAEGRRQSPIDIRDVRATEEPSVRTNFRPASLRIVHNLSAADLVNTGHSIQVNFPQGEALTIGDEVYSLVQFHFHGPSEHTVRGKRFPMEMHLVHMSAGRKLAVIAVFIEQGKPNKAFDPICSNLPAKRGVEDHLEHVPIDIELLMPGDLSAYRYDGSLTTPPCTEGVKWIVLRQPAHLSATQIRAFRKVLWKNNRSVQPLNGRTVLADVMQDEDE